MLAARAALRFSLALLLGLVLLHCPATLRGSAETGQVEIEPVTRSLASPPRGVVTFVYRALNETGLPASLFPLVELPEGWQLVVPPEPLDLDHGERASSLFSVLVPPSAPAGEYPILLRFREVTGIPVEPARFTVQVRPIVQIVVVPIESPTHAVAGEAYTARFSVQNHGNTLQRLVFRARQNLTLPVTLDPEGANLLPGQAQIVSARVRVPEDLARPTLHLLTLIASSPDDTQAEASASARVELIPQTPSEAARYHTFPLRLHLEPQFSTDEGGSIDWRLRGTGRLNDRDPGLLTLDAQQAHASLFYHREGFAASLGTQRFSISPLTEPGELGSGVQLQVRDGPWELTLDHRFPSSSAATGDPEAEPGHTGVRVSHRWASTGEELSLQLLTQPGLPGAVLSTRIQKPVTDVWGVGAEIGVQTDPERPAGAVYVETSWVDLPFSGMLSWEHSERGYRGQATAVEKTSMVGRLPLGRSGYVTLNWEETQAAGADLGMAPNDRRVTVYSGGPLAGGSWGVRYARGESVDPSAGTRRDHQGARLHLSQALPAIDSTLLQSVAWEQAESSPSGAMSESTAYQASLRLPHGSGSLTPYLGLTAVGREDGSELRWRVGLRTDQRPAEQTRFSALGQVEQAQELQYRLWGSVTHRLTTRADLTLQVDRQWTAASEPEYTVKLGYMVPILLPVGLRSDVGELAGRVVDEEGEGLSGMVVRVNGQAATTDADGRFRFPALPAGPALLSLDALQLGPDRVSIPETPWRVGIAAGERVEQTFRVVRGATVQGQLVLQARQGAAGQEGVVLGAGEEPSPDLLRGVVVELRNHATTLRRVTDLSGRFLFQRVPPGDWELEVLSSTLPAVYRVEPGSVDLSLEPGRTETVQISVIPLARRIRFLEEGVLDDQGAP